MKTAKKFLLPLIALAMMTSAMYMGSSTRPAYVASSTR
jgi:hypothetical protein